MNEARPQKSKLLSHVLIAAVFFILALCCGSIFFLVIINLSNRLPFYFSFSDLEGLSGLVTMALVIGGLVFTFVDRQQKEKEERLNNQTISYQHFETIHNLLTDPEREAARRWIYQNILPKTDEQPLEDWLETINKKIAEKPKGWDEPRTPGQKYIKMILNDLDFIGFVFDEYWNAEDKEVEWFSPPIAKVWERLAPYVAAQREARSEPDWYQAAAIIGEYAISWREKQGYADAEIIEKTV